IEEERCRFTHNGTSHGDTLALAARKLARLTLKKLFNFESLRSLRYATFDFVFWCFAVLQAVGKIFADRHMRVERIILKHHGDIAFSRFNIIDHATADRNGAGCNTFETGNHAQECGFTAARRAYQYYKFAVVDLQRYAFDDFDIAAIALADVIKNDFAHYFSVSTRPLTNQRCINTTTRIGGMMARMAVTMT